MFDTVLKFSQLIVTVIVGLYFFNQLCSAKSDENSVSKDSTKEMERIHHMRRYGLTKPLTEQTRPSSLSQIIGQADGLKALKIALGGKNPQHVLIYGPPGVGKTAAARVVLEYVKKTEESPFGKDAPFVEIDATTMHFDERCVADPLMGSVHDPIYQGAGAYGSLGVPQIKEGAVSKAHGGVLFVDEIGELSTMQMNRLLKVLEDRKVMYESAYYSRSSKQIPRHVKDVFENGMPADFRLVGATTRPPSKIPEALRSRCVEIYFNPLTPADVERVIRGACEKLDMDVEDDIIKYMACFSRNGRDSVKLTQMIAAKAAFENKKNPDIWDVDWVVKTGRFKKVLPERDINNTNNYV